MIHFIKTANQSFDIAYNDREILESSYLLAIIVVRTSQGFQLTRGEKYDLKPALIHQILTLRPEADRIVQNTNYTVTDHWYYDVANSLFCPCFITRFDPNCQITLNYLENFLGELEQVYDLPLSDKGRKTFCKITTDPNYLSRMAVSKINLV